MQLHAIERHGWPSLRPPTNRAQQIAAAAKHRRSFAERRRDGAERRRAVRPRRRELFDAAAADLGRDWACDLFFAAERDYWMSRNAAARVQYDRQQALGLGWGNHDHHTYRSSRESLRVAHRASSSTWASSAASGSTPAARRAGAPRCSSSPRRGVVIFADVDLTPDEVAGRLRPRAARAAGQARHGRPVVQAARRGVPRRRHAPPGVPVRLRRRAPAARRRGRRDDDAVHRLGRTSSRRSPRAKCGPCRPSGSTRRWPAATSRAEQAEQFRRDGALGSHLEILERNDGFKGFNQTGISEIITRTDPRKWTASNA